MFFVLKVVKIDKFSAIIGPLLVVTDKFIKLDNSVGISYTNVGLLHSLSLILQLPVAYNIVYNISLGLNTSLSLLSTGKCTTNSKSALEQ